MSSSLVKNENNQSVNNKKILIVEDDHMSQMLLSLMLKSFSTNFIYAKNGLEAITLFKENPDIDIIFMDINMPEMDGYEATKIIRETNKEVIIIAQTAFALSGDKEKALNSGCNDYITKPINKAKIHSLILKYLMKK